MSLEEFARIHNLGPIWVELRQECDRIVSRPDFWYRKELQSAARELAVKASDMLAAATKRVDSCEKPVP
jgi:hypothetical protein